ncbi:MAG: hypothetical protein GEU99_11665 [Luteitalea sp.]|nr:hypothetical protein [Luteitalea sp.]
MSRGNGWQPAYLTLAPTERWSRAERAISSLADCRACPRDCGVNRLEDKWAACKTGRHAVVGSYVNLMDQYFPAGKVSRESFTEINRRLDQAEYRQALQIARDLGLRRLDTRRPHPRLAARLA